jgi:ubiquinone/menaquinone biosynthesis C-methylase UbiE
VGVNAAAQEGFDGSADVYERARPTYPDDAVQALFAGCGIGPGSTVLDLAAGTGKLTRLLVASGAHVLAAEPVAGMRAQLMAALPQVPAVGATAEHLPFPSGSIDAVTVAQAFHWFDLEVAAAEIARVLRPGGAMGLIWNERDAEVPWVAELSRIIRWDERERWEVPYTTEVDWGARFSESDTPFPSLQRFDSSLTQEMDADLLVDRVLSTSYLARSDQEVQDDVEAQVRNLVKAFPPTFELPYVTVAYWSRLP